MGENQPFPDQIDPGPENWSIAAPLECVVTVAVARVVLCKKVHATLKKKHTQELVTTQVYWQTSHKTTPFDIKKTLNAA